MRLILNLLGQDSILAFLSEVPGLWSLVGFGLLVNWCDAYMWGVRYCDLNSGAFSNW